MYNNDNREVLINDYEFMHNMIGLTHDKSLLNSRRAIRCRGGRMV